MLVVRHLLARLAMLLLVAGASAATLVCSLPERLPDGADPVLGFAGAVEGFVPMPGSLRWLAGPGGPQGGPRAWHAAVFLAQDTSSELRDLWVAECRVDARGLVRQARRTINLSRAADADVAFFETAGQLLAYGSIGGDGELALHLLDLAGEPEDLTADWPWIWRMADRITNYQQTGRPAGIGRAILVFDQRPAAVSLSFDEAGTLTVETPAQRFEVDRRGRTDSRAVTVYEMVKGRPAPLAWAVDTARAVPWIGRHGIEWLERYWLRTSDWLSRVHYEVLGDSAPASLPVSIEALIAARDTGIPGWPPPDLAPLLPRVCETEGVWAPHDDSELFSRTGGPPLFYQTWLRVDEERPYARVHMSAWDPSMVELGIMAGTREPTSTTGLRGAGEVPRTAADGRDVSRLAGAFNGAFQGLHGEWGMVLDRRTWLPPRPYGATVARFDDGTVAFGSWPDRKGDLPEGMIDLRQNLLALVEGGVVNPYRRIWWGSAPPGVEERIHTVRSGLCLTHGGKLIYFWGEHQSPQTLGAAMLLAGCDYGIHLDMNAGHCGFEYYRVDPAGAELELDRPLEKWEAEGTVPRRPDLFYRARKMTAGMTQMRFPRYVGRDPRDFFYLLARPSIFDPAPDALAAPWTALGAREGYPVPVVAGRTREGIDIFRADPSQVQLSIEEERPDEALLALPFLLADGGGLVVGLVRGGEVLGSLRPGEPAIALGRHRAQALWGDEAVLEATALQGLPLDRDDLAHARIAFGLDDRGRLVVAEGPGGTAELAAVLEAAAVLYGAALPPADSAASERTFWLVARHDPVSAWRRIFEEVEPVPPRVWREVHRRMGRLLDHP